MQGKQHIAGGIIAAGISFGAAYIIDPDISMDLIYYAGAAVLGSLLPDIDLPKSKLGRLLKPISWPVNKLFGHRTITHSALWLIPYFILYLKCAPYPPIAHIVTGLALGHISHLLCDMTTPKGVPLLYPFSRHCMNLTKKYSGEKYRHLILPMFVWLCINVAYVVIIKSI